MNRRTTPGEEAASEPGFFFNRLDERTSDMRLGRWTGFVLLVGLLSADMGRAQEIASAGTNEFSEVINDLGWRFQPVKPTLVMEYEGAYAFLGMELKGLASLRISASEGTWQASDSATPVPACKLDFQLSKPNEKKDGTNDVVLSKRTMCVLRLPDLTMLRYVKLNDEVVKPLFGRNHRLRYIETYDFEADQARYLHRDLESGEVVTNLPNLETMARQSFELGKVLKNLHQAYLAKDSTNQPVVALNFNVNGRVKSFGLHTSKASLHAPLLEREVTVLRGDILGIEQESRSKKGFSVSCLPFRDVAAARKDPLLDVLAAQGQEWYMVPVAGRYELFLGGIECTLTGIHSEELPPKSL